MKLTIILRIKSFLKKMNADTKMAQGLGLVCFAKAKENSREALLSDDVQIPESSHF